MTDPLPPRQADSSPAADFSPGAAPARDAGSTLTDDTQRFAQPVFTPAPERATSRPSKGAVALILAAALLVGGLGGLAGAAGFNTVGAPIGGDAAPASPPTGQPALQVSDSSDTPASAGSVEQVAASVLPSVVKISVAGPRGAGSGSGVVLSEDGEILTNHHVVAGAAGGRIAVGFDDGSTTVAKVVGTDPLTDLAVIRAEDVSGLTPVRIGRSGDLDVGENVVAVGSPFGLAATVTSGIVSALRRPVSVGGGTGTETTYPAIQTDAAINPGNSGGPLVNLRGELVGINSSIRSVSGGMGEAGSIGLGFAIPIDNVLPIIDQLRAGEAPTHARLGVGVVEATSNDGLISGAGIQTVAPGSAAERAGLERGDIITKVDGEVVTGYQSLVATIRGHRPGDEVTLTVVRAGTTDEPADTVTVTLDSDEGTAAS